MWANISAYGKLAIVTLLILGEPMVMDRYGEVTPWAIQHVSWNAHDHDNVASQGQHGGRQEAAANPLWGTNDSDSRMAGNSTNWQTLPGQTPGAAEPQSPSDPDEDRTIYDTARRLWKSVRE